MEDGMDTGGGPFDAIDSNLTVFALANGLDLEKGDDFRRLEWFSEGLERCIVVAADGSGDFSVAVRTWRSGRPEATTEAPVATGLSVDEIRKALPGAIDTANALDATTPE
jgi:hypothetical protein